MTVLQQRRQQHHSVNKEVSEVLYEKRLLTFITGLTGVGVLVWLVALATDYWIVVVANEEGGIEVASPSNGTAKRAFLWSHSGLWKCCAMYKVRTTSIGKLFSFKKWPALLRKHFLRMFFYILTKNKF